MNIHLTDPGTYYQDMHTLSRHLHGNRQGFIQLDVYVFDAREPVQVMMRCLNLYIAGFRSRATGVWYRFQGEPFPPETPSQELPSGSNYAGDLGGLNFSITLDSLRSINRLNSYNDRFGYEERNAVRHLAVAISEALRFANVITWMMALLRGYHRNVEVGNLASEIRNWSGGSTDQLPGILIPHQ